MNDKQENLTDEEIEDLQVITNDVIVKICVMADKHNIDRDSMLKYFADMLIGFTNVASIQNYKTNEHTNADRIRNMSDEELANIIFNDSCIAIMKLEECPHANDHRADMHNVCKECIFEWLQSEAE